jgi:hypothetical protein
VAWIITEPNSQTVPSGNYEQLKFQPNQCDQTPWEIWYKEQNPNITKLPSEQAMATDFYGTAYGISLTDFQRIDTGLLSCDACHFCSTGYYFEAKVDASSATTLIEQGWKKTGSDLSVSDLNLIAESYIKNLPTFQVGGYNLVYTGEYEVNVTGKELGGEIVNTDYNFLTYDFSSQYSGFGNTGTSGRISQTTPHTVTLGITDGYIRYAVMDGVWDMNRQELIQTTLRLQDNQLQTVPWDQWYSSGNSAFSNRPPESRLASMYFFTQYGIKSGGFSQIQTNGTTYLQLNVAQNDIPAMLEMGWEIA